MLTVHLSAQVMYENSKILENLMGRNPAFKWENFFFIIITPREKMHKIRGPQIGEFQILSIKITITTPYYLFL